MRSSWCAFALVVVAVGCSSSKDDAPSLDGATVHVDEDDVYCDPVDALTDDTTPATPSAEPLTQWVDPRIGTGGIGFAVGTTYPGPQAPFGMAKPGPDTSRNGHSEDATHCSGYAYEDDYIEGFSLARLHGAGIADYGGIALMPTVGMTAAKAKPRSHGSHFSHDTETTKPGYYAVTLADTGIRVELTATPRVGIMRYAFPAGADEVVTVDVGHVLADNSKIVSAEVAIDAAAHEVSGTSKINGSYSSRYGGVTLYFVARFDRAFSQQGTYVGGVLSDALTATGIDAGAALHFDATSANVGVSVGLSYVDVAHARANLDAEVAPFDTAEASLETTWATRLGALHIDARNDRDRRIAYTALYHTSLMPTLASDVDGGYRGIDGNVHQADGFRYFTDFSLWDTYRTLHPLITLLYPNDARELAASLGAMAKDAGFVPRWPLGVGESGGMVGDGGTVVLADTYVKGIRDWDAAGAYAVAKHQATTPEAPGAQGGRDGMEDYLSLGYVSKDSGGSSAGKTLEYASADFALGELAAALGETADADTFHARSKTSWQKIYDPASYLFVGKRRDGTSDEPNPIAMSEDFSEGTPWHYNFMVPHDAEGLAARMGKDMLLARAEQLFTRAACGTPPPSFLPNPYYWASNEPVLFSGWIFSAVGDQERTARWIRWTTLTHYSDTPDGLPGNDDGGTMSAFYLFAALGFYPIAGTDQYVLGAPLFPHATLAVAGGTLTIDAPAASKQHRFPRAVTRNGAPAANIVHHADLANATLSFTLETTPLKDLVPAPKQ